MRKAVFFLSVALASSAWATAGGNQEACTIESKAPCAPTGGASLLGKYGVQQGDVVVSLDGKKVPNPDDSRALLEMLSTGTVKKVVVLRNGQRKTLTIKK